MTGSLENLLNGIKTAWDIRDEVMLKSLGISDNYKVLLYGPAGDEYDKNGILFKTVTSDMEASCISNEFFPQVFSLREACEMKDFNFHHNIKYYNVDDKIVIVQVNKIYLMNNSKPDYGLVIGFHPYQIQDYLPNQDSFMEEGHLAEGMDRWKIMVEEKYPGGTIIFAMAKVIHDFGKYVIKREFRANFDSTRHAIRHG